MPQTNTEPIAAAAASRAVAVSPPTPADRVQAVANHVRLMLASGRVDAGSAFAVFKAAAQVGASWDVAVEAVAELAKGADGVAGTADDLIPQQTVTAMQAMLAHGVLADVAHWASSIAPFAAPAAPRWLRLVACGSIRTRPGGAE